MNAPGPGTAPAPAPPAPAPSPLPAAPAAPPPAQPSPPAPTEGQPTAPNWDTDTRAYIESLRREAAGNRTENKQLKDKVDGLTKSIATALGIKVDGQPADPEQLQREIAKLQTTNRSLSIDNALIGESSKAKVKLPLLRALMRDQGEYEKLDPNDANFTKSLHEAVKRIADEYPDIKETAGVTPPAPAPRGGVPAGGGGAPPADQWTMDELNLARKQGREQEIKKAYDDGKLDKILKRTA